jgi:hypothetical protein
MENDQVMIHVRFATNGTVMEIGERPAAMTSQQWFDLLSRSTTDCYESLSGGRGLFRVPRTEIDTLKSATV